MKLLLLMYILVPNLNVALSCITSDDIECSCFTDTIKCFGSGENSSDLQQLFLNISLIHPTEHLNHLILNITDLNFPTNFSIRNLKIRNLSLIGQLQNIEENFFGDWWSDLQFLSIENYNVESVGNYSFSVLNNLTELHLDSNGIKEIKSDAFFNLNGLEFLSISNNNLGKIDENLLLRSPHLHTLILNGNNISQLSDIHAVSVSLRKLSLQNCLMQGDLEEKTLSSMSNLEDVDLSLNYLKTIITHSLSSLSSIKTLNLSKNVIESLNEHAFSKIVSLEVLDLSKNKISIIKTTAFRKLVNLKQLDLSSNILRAMLCDYTFDLHSLERVDLQNNRIKTINAGTFLYSPNIQDLFLKGNELADPDAVICSPLQNITIAFIDIDFQSKNCEMPESCGPLLTEKDDEEYDYEDINITTTMSHISTLATKMESSSSSLTTTIIVTESTPLTNITEKEEIKNSTETSSNYPVNITELVSTTFSSTSSSVSENTTDEGLSNSTYFDKITTEPNNSTLLFSTEITHITKEDTTTEEEYDYEDEHPSSIPTTSASNVSPEISSATITILNYTYFENNLCLKWKITGFTSSPAICRLKYDSSKGRHFKHLVCPENGNLSDECIEINDMFEFCLMIYVRDMRIDKACFPVHSLSSTESQNTTFYVPPTTLSATSTFKSSIEINTPTSTFKPEVTPNIQKSVYFNVTYFDVFFNDSKSALIVWGVNNYQDNSVCNLTLVLIYTDPPNSKMAFPCSNNSHRVKSSEGEIHEICLLSNHRKYGSQKQCKYNSIILYGASTSGKYDQGYKNHSLIALTVILLVILAVIIFIVMRNLSKKRNNKDRYNVYVEEQNVQKRLSSLNEEPNVRYSYISKE